MINTAEVVETLRVVRVWRVTPPPGATENDCRALVQQGRATLVVQHPATPIGLSQVLGLPTPDDDNDDLFNFRGGLS